jgi:ABC-type branched-subunit amino acid transport system substrate-binding protein
VAGALGWGLWPVEAAPRSRLRVGFIAPTRTGFSPVRVGAALQVAGDAGRWGAEMAAEEIDPTSLNPDAERLQFLPAAAPDPETTLVQARRLMASERVAVLVGGFDDQSALVLSQEAERRRVVFLNVGATSDLLRHERCGRYTFHVMPSAAMLLDALATWFAGREVEAAGGRRVRRRPVGSLFLLTPDSAAGKALEARAEAALRKAGWRGRVVGRLRVKPDLPDYYRVLEEIKRARPELVWLLLDATAQLDFVDQAEAFGLGAEVSGFGDAPSQTYSFLAALHDASRRLAAGVRPVAWDLQLPGAAGRLSYRFRERWGQPMGGVSWTCWVALHLVWRAALLVGSTEPDRIVRGLEAMPSFEGGKGRVLSFRRWDHQLRQPLYLIRMRPDPKDVPWDLTEVVGVVPGRGEDLDRLGDDRTATRCTIR